MGRKMNVTIKDVAKAAGVSIGTVDRALNNRARISEETKERVMKAVKELNYQRNEFASAIRKGVRMKILVINARNPYNYMNIFTKAFQEQAAEYAGYGMELEFVFSNTLGADDVRQVAEGVKVEEYDGILINASGQELNDFINRTRKAGIPIATFNSDAPDSQRIFFSGEDHFKAGRLCGELTAKFLCGRGSVAVFAGNETVFAHRERIGGFCDVLTKEYPNIEITNIVCHEDRFQLAKERAKELMQPGNFPDAVFCNSAVGGVPFCQYLEEKSFSKRPLVIAYDEGEELVEMLKKNICTAIIFQEPTMQAKKALSYMFDALYTQKEWPTERECQIMPSVVMRENCDVYFKHLQNN